MTKQEWLLVQEVAEIHKVLQQYLDILEARR